jgi:predicted GH43/DUF377 family glycosyl hydrolase
VNRREWCRRSAQIAALLAVSDRRDISSWQGTSTDTQRLRHLVHGNYELRARLSGPWAAVSFSGREEVSNEAVLELSPGSVVLARSIQGARTVLKEFPGIGKSPWNVRLLKKGNYFRFWVADVAGWVSDPLGVFETNHPEAQSEPINGYLGIQGSIESAHLTELPWLSPVAEPVIKAGPDGTFKEDHVLVGGVVEYDGKYYQYFSGARHGCQEGGGAREIGVAHSADLVNWIVESEPILRTGGKDSWEPTGLYCSGAVVTPDRKVAVMYAAQKFPLWMGFGLAVAEHPLGPFTKHAGNPVYKHYTHAHEFDLVRTDEPGRRYLLFYSGFTDVPRRGPAGDRGYLLYSDDLIQWTPQASNPTFGPETLDNWDAIHVRPRSLTKIGDTWYLWYEGTNHWDPPSNASDIVRPGWWDTVGLARSKDLLSWEYYPRNPALPASGISKSQFDSTWTGWPRMVIRNGLAYVFYTGGHHIGMRTIPVSQLTNWESEGGRTLDLLELERTR